MDCDGVLTDGKITITADHDEIRSFHVRDGFGIVLWHRAGYRSGIISGRFSRAVQLRAHELEISYLRQGAADKIIDFEEIIAIEKLGAEEVAYIGDDIPDVLVMRRVGFAAAVADAVEEARACAHYVTRVHGGYGAAREVIELILKTQNKWNGST
ncbi:MAG: KdsC family phosphatase [Pyrinomonadaceae bacterium]